MNDPNVNAYQVICNSRGEQMLYAIDADVPPGWTPMGMQGPLSICIAYLRQAQESSSALQLKRCENCED